MSLETLNKKIQDLYTETDRRKSLDIAIDAANEVIKVLKPSVDNLLTGEDALDRAIPVNQFPNQKVENWFSGHPYFTGDKVALRFYEDEMVETKFYWLNDTSTKARVSAGVMLTPNWEDSELTRNDNYKLGVDFFLTHDTKSLLVVISNMGNLRILELNNKLSHTQYEIFTNLKSALQLDSREQSHQILWDSLALSEVNKKFYAGVAEQFNILLNHLISSGRDKEDAKLFASRLLGRLLFVWFLRRKGIISEDYGYFEVNNSNSAEYYSSKLKKLFFETLNVPTDKRQSTDTKTPYLNGGLFEAHQNDWPNETVDFPTGFFNGLYEHLEKYNFTTDESSPEYEQVAIDPEMLGRVFESLLATQVTETGDQARKAKGTFYTPREIVSYMCKASLRQYLYTKLDNESWNDGVDRLLDTSDSEWELNHTNSKRNLWGEGSLSLVPPKVISALDELTILDPACGSGAFPMGMLQLVLKTYERLDTRFDSYRTKLQIIQNNIFGVDIEPMAVEISRLRAWLSLVVDDEDDNKVEPLPNLDFKFVCANSLVPLEKQTGLFGDSTLHEKLAEVRSKFFNARKPEMKEKWKDEYYKLTTKQLSMDSDRREIQLKSFDPFKNQHPSEFFDSDFMFGVEAFDIVIGNPPYVRHEKIKIKNILQNSYDIYTSTADLYTYFFEMGLKNISKQGHLIYITSSKYTRALYGENLRSLLRDNTNIIEIIDFGNAHMFDAITNTSILLVQNNKADTSHELKYYKGIKNTPTNFKQSELKTKYWILDNPLVLKIKDKIDYIGTPIEKTNNQIYYGLKTGLNDAFLINNETRNLLIEKDSNSEEIIKPLLRGRDIGRYKQKDITTWILATKNGIDVKSQYPAIYEYLKEYDDNHENRLQKRSDKGDHWTNLRDCAYYEEMESSKIVWLELSAINKFQLTRNGEYILAGAFMMSGENLEYLLGILNSKLSLFYFKLVSNSSGMATMQWKKFSVGRIPVVNPSSTNFNTIEAIKDNVDSLLETGGDASIERKVDELVYRLYGLTKEEIETIESYINE